MSCFFQSLHTPRKQPYSLSQSLDMMCYLKTIVSTKTYSMIHGLNPEVEILILDV